MNHDPLICSVCGGPVLEQSITYTQRIGERLYVFTEVPAMVCPRDGEQYLAPDVVDDLQRTIAAGKTPQRTIEVPVYEFSRSGV
jgi:YgiT-type zinc finger domain-containing protein